MNYPPRRRTYSVSEITGEVKSLLEETFHDVSVEGEISNFLQASSGHIYFVLKDKGAQIKCAFFKNKARYSKCRLGDGQQVVVTGSIGVYEPRGEYQLYVDYVEPKGIGELQRAFEKLKMRLEMEGLFDASHKKPLPFLPRKIGVITSPTGAVIQDILRIVGRRHHNMQILLYPSKVQGDEAAREIAAGIEYLNTVPDIDVMIVGRGGGSIEDLWPFNEEVVARAIYHSKIPVISAVGHETDFTIADFVADLRAPTPSAAAELVVAQKSELIGRLEQLERLMTRGVEYCLSRWKSRLLMVSAEKVQGALVSKIRLQQQRLDEQMFRLHIGQTRRLAENRSRLQVLLKHLERFDPVRRIEHQKQWVLHQSAGLRAAFRFQLQTARGNLQRLAGQLEALGPQGVLDRGYAFCRNESGEILLDSRQVVEGDLLNITLSRGSVASRAEKIFPPED
jgi:exodeoxyribonuclease VII large subunit